MEVTVPHELSRSLFFALSVSLLLVLLCTTPKHTPAAGLDADFACSAEQPRFEAVDGCESAYKP
jgi:hypothetical protein